MTTAGDQIMVIYTSMCTSLTCNVSCQRCGGQQSCRIAKRGDFPCGAVLIIDENSRTVCNSAAGVLLYISFGLARRLILHQPNGRFYDDSHWMHRTMLGTEILKKY